MGGSKNRSRTCNTKNPHGRLRLRFLAQPIENSYRGRLFSQFGMVFEDYDACLIMTRQHSRPQIARLYLAAHTRLV